MSYVINYAPLPPTLLQQADIIEVDFHPDTADDKVFTIVNHILAVGLIFLSTYIMFIPFLPELTTVYNKATDTTRGYKYVSKLTKQETPSLNIDIDALKPIPQDNVLVIPQIGVDSNIVEGSGPDALNYGLWHRPNTSTPDKGGNTVITGHRFLYTSGPKTFYNLDKINIGEKFFLYWKGKEYDYEVVDKFIVNPDQVEVESNTEEPILTLYTCHPLFTAKQRLVVRARLLN